jgi:hypothetical protein
LVALSSAFSTALQESRSIATSNSKQPSQTATLVGGHSEASKFPNVLMFLLNVK